MQAKELKAILNHVDDETEILVADNWSDRIAPTSGVTIETDMRDGNLKLMVVATAVEAGNLRDYEAHPGYEDVNRWCWEKEETTIRHWRIHLTAEEIEWLRWELEGYSTDVKPSNRVGVKLAIARNEPIDPVVGEAWKVDLLTGLTHDES